MQTKPTLIIGAGGMLGRAVRELLSSRERPFDAGDLVADQGAGVGRFDLTSASDLDRIRGGTWGTVINCSAWTDVDGAEADEAGATALNGDAVRDLAKACRDGGAVCVHFSTDYVFDGKGTSPYAVDHPIAPVNAYGRSKAVGEAALVESGCEHLLIRTSWLYGAWGKNFVLTMASLMQSRDTLSVVNDQRGRPTSVRQLARTTLSLLEADARGVFHGCDGGECTWHGFASEIRNLIDADTAIEPCTSEAFPRPAARPAYSVLDLASTIAIAGEPRPWQDELRAVIDEWKQSEMGATA